MIFTVYVKDYIIKITFLISDNEYQINLEFLNYILSTIKNFKQIIINDEQKNIIESYIKYILNNPKKEYKKYFNIPSNKNENTKTVKK